MREDDRADLIAMTLERPHARARGCVPDLDRAIPRSRRELPRVVREGDRPDPTPTTMPLERPHARARRRVPDLDRAIARSRRELPRVAREGDRPDRTAMALERLHARARRRVPDLDRVIVRSRRELPRVVREGDRLDPTAMALKRLQTWTPLAFHNRLSQNPFWLFPLPLLSRQAVSRAEYKR